MHCIFSASDFIFLWSKVVRHSISTQYGRVGRADKEVATVGSGLTFDAGIDIEAERFRIMSRD